MKTITTITAAATAFVGGFLLSAAGMPIGVTVIICAVAATCIIGVMLDREEKRKAQ